MSIEKLARMDLNLMVCLKVLIEEKSVTKTASKLCLSQSAVSKALSKLRIQFDDPLFIRNAHGITPTPKALFLKPKLDVLIKQLEQLTQPEQFSPAASNYRFQIAAVESVYSLIMPHFLPEIFKQAPGVTISTHTWSEETFKQIQKGEIDLGITGRAIDINDVRVTTLIPNDIYEREIYRDTQVCLLRKDHPVLAEKWDLDKYLEQRHVQVRCDRSDKWLLDYHLADIGKERDIAITVPDFNGATSICTYTDFIFTAPCGFANLTSKQLDLTVLPLPFEFPPMAYTLFWHRDRENDPALVWIRQIIHDYINHKIKPT